MIVFGCMCHATDGDVQYCAGNDEAIDVMSVNAIAAPA